jgi:hypothetical protein
MDRRNFRIQDRSRHREQFQNVKSGFSALTMEEGSRPKPSRLPSSGPQANIEIRFVQNTGPPRPPPTSGPPTNIEPRFMQSTGPPRPLPNWNNKAPMNGTYTRRQDAAFGAVPHHKQVKKVYQVKTRSPQET